MPRVQSAKNRGVNLELFLPIIGAIVCMSMARKRGRGPVKWFFLGLFFHVFAIAVLFFKGNADGFSTSPSAGQVFQPLAGQNPSGIRPPVRQNPPVFQPSQTQNGEVDLNSLRAAVRQQPNESSAPTTGARGNNGVLEPERQSFLDSLASTLATINFGPVPATTARALSQVWMDLGTTLVFSDLAGGLNENSEFYQCHDDDAASGVWFYPVSPDGSANSVMAEFAVPVKRFANGGQMGPESVALQQWVDSQPRGGFAQVVLQRVDPGNDSVLMVRGQCNPNLVTADSLGELCEQVRTKAVQLRQTIPSSLGGIWI